MWEYLEPVARMLEPLTVVHRFDQRGCGGSDPSRQHAKLATWPTSKRFADVGGMMPGSS